MTDEFDDAGVTERPGHELGQDPEQDERTGRAAAVARMQRKAHYVDLQVQQAMARGDFDDLPGAGKPLQSLDRPDKDWWLRQLVERERLTGLLPPALGLRKEDAELDDALDREGTEDRVREVVDDFNRRVVEARRQLVGGPPVITDIRDIDVEVRRWRDRRDARLAARRRQVEAERATAAGPEPAKGSPSRRRRRRWFRRNRGS